MPNGTVKFFNVGKGFGFITSDESGKDVFVPSASVTASGLAGLKPGQRVAFEEVPDAKGPKAANLTVLAEAPRPVLEKERPAVRPEPRARLTFYHDPASEWSEQVLEEIRAEGHDPLVVNYLLTPPTKDELRRLSRLLQGRNQSLVRKYDSLFLELRLDDRFIGESEFWDAIVEHPGLINGPLLATDAKASLCHSDEAVDAFFAAAEADEIPVAKPKGLSLRALQILAGPEAPPAATVARAPEPELVAVEAVTAAPARQGKLVVPIRARVAAEPVATIPDGVKPAAKALKPAAKPVAKSKSATPGSKKPKSR